MKQLALLGGVLCALVLAAGAQAKGPIAASIDGPGTGGGISIGGDGEPGSGAPLGNLAQESGLFPALFGQTPDPMLDGAPAAELGPRYTIRYRLPGPNGQEDEIRQDLYPYANSGPVTYTKPGQRFFETHTTRGGWFQGPPALMDTLVQVGLPRTAPGGGGDGDGLSFADVWLPAAVGLALALAALAAVLVRRRPRPAATG